jgi:hypothetical protein
MPGPLGTLTRRKIVYRSYRPYSDGQPTGQLLVGVVLAHEYGHAIQTRLGLTDQPTVVVEQQADCFAGAWLADALAGHSTAFTGITPAQLDSTVAGLLLRDQPGTSATAEGAHGNAFDTIRALHAAG